MRRWLRIALVLLFALIGIGLLLWMGGRARKDAPPEPPAPPAPSAPAGLLLLEHRTLDGGRRVEGRFGAVRFEAEATEAAGARARYWLDEAESGSLTVTITSETEGVVAWAGRSFDGQGALAEDAVAALETLAGSSLAQAVARIPLDLACRPDAEPIPAAVGAALLMPWQLLLKYAVDQPVEAARAQALQSTCGYFERRTAAGPLMSAHPQLLMLSRDQPIPMALPYLPLDGAGQRGSQQP